MTLETDPDCIGVCFLRGWTLWVLQAHSQNGVQIGIGCPGTIFNPIPLVRPTQYSPVFCGSESTRLLLQRRDSGFYALRSIYVDYLLLREA